MKYIITFVVLLLLGFGYLWHTLLDVPEDIAMYEAYTETLQSFETEKGIMRYSDAGTGKAILLVHGVPTNSWMYKDMSDALVQEGYRVIAPDLMGFGASDHFSSYSEYGFDTQAQLLLDLMNSLGINQWEHVAHDMGGLVTWEMLDQAPEKISHLYILNTIIYEDTFNPPVDFNRRSKIQRWMLGLHSHPYIGKLIINTMISNAVGDTANISPEQKVGYWLPMRTGSSALVHFFTETTKIKETLDQKRNILIDSNIPVSVLWGQSDPFLDVGSAIRLQSDLGLDKEDVVILEGAKHLVPQESYQEIVEYIVKRYE